MPAGPFRLLVWSLAPLPESPVGIDPHDIGTQLVPGTGANASASIPVHSVAGHSLFVRLFVLGADAIEVVAASNTFVITPP